MSSHRDLISECFATIGRLAGLAVETISPGRQAGFHVDRIVMRARRVTELLNATPPNTAVASQTAGYLASDLGLGMGPALFRAPWSGTARDLVRSELFAKARNLMELNVELMRLLGAAPVELSTAQKAAAAVLAAAEDLRTRAYAFEDSRRTQTPPVM